MNNMFVKLNSLYNNVAYLFVNIHRPTMVYCHAFVLMQSQ